MTLKEWNATKSRLNAACSTAYRSGDTHAHAQALAARAAHDELRPAIEAQTVVVKQQNRAHDANRKKPAPPDWRAQERHYKERRSIERLMTQRTGVNVGHP